MAEWVFSYVDSAELKKGVEAWESANDPDPVGSALMEALGQLAIEGWEIVHIADLPRFLDAEHPWIIVVCKKFEQDPSVYRNRSLKIWRDL